MYFFTNVQSFYYWSSTTLDYYAGSAWLVHLDVGLVDFEYKTFNSFYVWPVRGGH
jgi:hypothetical protein